MGTLTWRRAVCMCPALGVIPPDDKSLQSSIRCAPPRSAAMAWSTDSTQISRTKPFCIFLLLGKAGCCCLATSDSRSNGGGRPLERVLCHHLNCPWIPQIPKARLRGLRKYLTARAVVDLDQRAEVARLQVALDSATAIRSTVDVLVPK